MKAFFRDMNLARGIILASVLGALVLGLLGWQRRQRVVEMRENYHQDVAKLVHQIEQLGRKHTTLSSALRKDPLASQSDLESYIRSIAALDRVEIGNVNISGNEAQTSVRGVVDRKYLIKPSDRERVFPRSKIANFLYKLEAESRRVKVTDVDVEVGGKQKLKPHEIPEDNWTFTAELTSRVRTE